jgi:hypothetical protein
MSKNRALLALATGSTTATAFALLTVLGGGPAAADLQDSPAAAATNRTDGFDPATCRPQPAAAAPDAGAGQSRTGDTQVSFVVPPTTLIQVDELGRPIAVTTNTGQAPCVTDVFVQVAADGTALPAADTLSTTVLSVHFGSDWAPGEPQVFPAA